METKHIAAQFHDVVSSCIEQLEYLRAQLSAAESLNSSEQMRLRTAASKSMAVLLECQAEIVDGGFRISAGRDSFSDCGWFTAIPDDILQHIFQYLDAQSPVELVCKRWREVHSDQLLWKRMYAARWNMHYFQVRDDEDWRQRYISRLYAQRWAEVRHLTFRHAPSTTPVTCLQYDHERQCIISGSEAGTVKVFSRLSMAMQHRFVLSEVAVRKLLLRGKHLLGASEDGGLKMWDVESGVLVREFAGHRACIESLVFVSAMDRNVFCFVTGSFDFTMKLWRTDRAEPMRVFQGHKHLILQVGVARKCLVKPSGRFRMDMTVFEDQELHQAETESADDVVDAEAVRYPCVLISISYDRNVVVWDATNAQQITGMHCSGRPFSLCVQDGIVFVAEGTTLHRWELASGIRTNVEFISLMTHVSVGGNLLFAGGHQLCMYDSRTLQLLCTVETAPVVDMIYDMSFVINIFDAVEAGTEMSLKVINRINTDRRTASLSSGPVIAVGTATNAVKLYYQNRPTQSCP